MPAMSPTMTEGNIASWKVKEGESFSTGDVLLEIETDKAQMDVEAQDDGQMAKITQPDGSKGVKVGTRIAIIAEPDDDLRSLPPPGEDIEPSRITSPQDETQSDVDASQPSESQAEAPPTSKGEDKSSAPSLPSASPSTSSKKSSSKTSSKPSKQKYPLYPSVSQLLHEKGVPPSEIDKIPASGPKGRLLKGDVLAYIGTISKSYPSDQSSRISELGNLNLSNVKTAPPRDMPTSSATATSSKASISEAEPDSKIAVTISLESVLEVQRRIQRILHINLPLSTFITRAIQIANTDLPQPNSSEPTADELFNQVLGLYKVNSKSSRGSFIPEILALPPPSRTTFAGPQKPVKQPDIIDLLTNKTSTIGTRNLPLSLPGMMAGSASGASTNVFSVSVPKREEKRAKVFLERIKTILQVEPGRLVL